MMRSPRVLTFPKDGTNAFLRLFSGHLEAGGAVVDDFSFPRAWWRRYDVVHLHWPDTHLRTHSWWRALGKHARLALLCVVLRLRRTRIVWMLHNLKPHERDHWISRRLFPLWFPRLCTHVIALTPVGLDLARLFYPPLRRKPAAIVPHGHYREIYPFIRPRAECRARLGLPVARFTFLFFGSIRGYKNVPLLIDVFRRLRAADVQLVVAGEPVLGARAEDLYALASGDDRIRFHLRYIDHAEVPDFFGAADLVVLPFADVLNSGSVLLALSMNRPVLAPRLGALTEVADAVGSRWLRLYERGLNPALLDAARMARDLPPEDAQVDLSAFDWSYITDLTLRFYVEPVAVPRE